MDDQPAITVVCDSAKHARGKVVTIMAYDWDGGEWASRPQFREQALRVRRGDERSRQKRQRRIQAAKSAGATPEDYLGPPWRHSLCNLCGAKLWPLPTQDELSYFTTRGESRISITQLQLLRLHGKR